MNKSTFIVSGRYQFIIARNTVPNTGKHPKEKYKQNNSIKRSVGQIPQRKFVLGPLTGRKRDKKWKDLNRTWDLFSEKEAYTTRHQLTNTNRENFWQKRIDHSWIISVA